MKKYFILFLIMSVLNSCTKEQIIGWSVLTVLSAPYPIYVATVGVPGVTIGEAIGIGIVGAAVFGLIILPMIDCLIDSNGKTYCGNAKK